MTFKKIQDGLNYHRFLGTGLLFLASAGLLFFHLSQHFSELLSLSQVDSAISYLFLVSAIAYFVITFDSGQWKSFSYRFGLAYLYYLICSMIIQNAYQLNNPEFLSENWLDNGFFQPQLLYLPIIIIVCNLLIRKIEPNLLDHQGYLTGDGALIGLLSVTVLCDQRLLVLIEPLVKAAIFDQRVIWELVFVRIFLPLLALFSLISFSFLGGLKALMNRKLNCSLALSTSFSFSILVNYFLQESYKGKESLLGYFSFPGAMAFQIFFFTVLFFLAYLVLNRYSYATVINLGSAILLVISNQLKIDYRSEPVLTTDIVWLKQIPLLLTFTDKKQIQLLVIYFLVLLILGCLLRWYFRRGALFPSVFSRVTVLTSLVLALLGTKSLLEPDEKGKIIEGVPVISRLNNIADINWLGFTVNARYRSLAYVWFKQLTTKVMEKPEDYSEEAIKKIVETYKEEAQAINKSRSNYLEEQTVIVMLSESFSDPLRLPGVSLSQEILPTINAVKTSHTSGTMTADFYGGGTANMEMQALMGLPYYNLSPTVASMTTEVIPKMSQVPFISDFYQPNAKVAIHFHNASNYSRNTIYKDKGFSTFVALDGTDDKPTQLEFNGANASDRSTYFAIENNLTSDTPQFFSVITMQNHMPWTKENPAEITGTGPDFTEEENTQLSHYARLLHDTDIETKALLESLSQKDKKITLLFYGDHLPGLYPNHLFSENPQLQYETDYFIWSNFETEKLNYQSVNSSDFPALLLKQTNSKVSPYYALLTDLLDTRLNNESTPQSEAIATAVKMIEYDLILGKNYLKNFPDFFEIKGEEN